MDFEALHSLIVSSIDRAPQRLGDRAVFQHDRLELAQDLAPLVDIERAFRLGEQLIELVERHLRLGDRRSG